MGVKRRRDEGTAWQVDIEIDRLVIHGFDRIDRDAVAASFWPGTDPGATAGRRHSEQRRWR